MSKESTTRRDDFRSQSTDLTESSLTTTQRSLGGSVTGVHRSGLLFVANAENTNIPIPIAPMTNQGSALKAVATKGLPTSKPGGSEASISENSSVHSDRLGFDRSRFRCWVLSYDARKSGEPNIRQASLISCIRRAAARRSTSFTSPRASG